MTPESLHRIAPAWVTLHSGSRRPSSRSPRKCRTSGQRLVVATMTSNAGDELRRRTSAWAHRGLLSPDGHHVRTVPSELMSMIYALVDRRDGRRLLGAVHNRSLHSQ